MIGSTLKTDRSGVDHRGGRRDTSIRDRIASEAKPVDAVILRRHEPNWIGLLSELPVLIRELVPERHADPETRFVLHHVVVRALQCCRLFRVLQKEINDDLWRWRLRAVGESFHVCRRRYLVEEMCRELGCKQSTPNSRSQCQVDRFEECRLPCIVVADDDVQAAVELKREGLEHTIVLDVDFLEHGSRWLCSQYAPAIGGTTRALSDA